MLMLGYVQIDTISVVQRAHHHTLWSRNHSYIPQHLERMVKEKVVFEYWSHAASYLAMRDFRFTLPRKHAIKSDQQNHWFQKNPRLMSEVLARITVDGPLMAKDFELSVTKKSGWESKPTKQALEMLYMQGDLMMVYLLKGVKSNVQLALDEMQEEGVIIRVSVAGDTYFILPQSLELTEKRLRRKQAKILSPFDNFIIQRPRVKELFDFNYQLECYVPAAKRQYGYFVLPIVWDGRLVARADCKAYRKTAHLEIKHLYIEPKLARLDEFEVALHEELQAFATFNGCDGYTITQRGIKPNMQ